MRISRRTLLAASAVVPFVGVARAADAVSIQLNPQKRLRVMPPDFMGLGFELSAVATPGLLSSGNRAYVQLVRNLGKGVIRIGGNVSDYTRYDVGAPAAFGHKSTVLNYESLRQFRGFLDAVGWKLIGFPGAQYGYSNEQMQYGADLTKLPIMTLADIQKLTEKQPELFYTRAGSFLVPSRQEVPAMPSEENTLDTAKSQGG